MFVNQTLLKKEHIHLPDNDWTLDDFYTICQQVTKDTNKDGQIDQYGCYNYDWLDSVYSHKVNLFDENAPKWNTDSGCKGKDPKGDGLACTARVLEEDKISYK